jgi:hypothetical protein
MHEVAGDEWTTLNERAGAARDQAQALWTEGSALRSRCVERRIVAEHERASRSGRSAHGEVSGPREPGRSADSAA